MKAGPVKQFIIFFKTWFFVHVKLVLFQMPRRSGVLACYGLSESSQILPCTLMF